ncbi:MAG: hypothetical protein F4X65_03825 [Chloroflexi bacterium]|nr:hypothetical protein [Chloroflexota bacterium]
MQEADTIQVLGRGTSVDFTIDDAVPFEIAERSLREYLEVCRGLYSSGTVSVNVGRRILAPDQLSAIKGILDSETGLTVSSYWCAPEILQSALFSRPAAPTLLPHQSQEAVHPPPDTETAYLAACPEGLAVREAAEGRQLSFDFTGSHPQPVTHDVSHAAPDLLPGESKSVEMAETGAGDSGMSAEPRFSEDGLVVEGQTAVIEGLPEPTGHESVHEDSQEYTRETIPADSFEIPGEVLPSHAPYRFVPYVENGVRAFGEDMATGQVVHRETEGDAGAASDDPEELIEGSPREPRRGNAALIIKNTCRSGEVIRYPGDVVVFGDVNPGAVIVADGDIIVLGALRGMAQAGAGDDPKATILALNLESQRLQIGQHAGEAPRDLKRHRHGNRNPGPQIAYLRRGSVFVAPFARRLEQYQGGILYEG